MIWRNIKGEVVEPSKMSYSYLENSLFFWSSKRDKLLRLMSRPAAQKIFEHKYDETLLYISAIISTIKEELVEREKLMDKQLNQHDKSRRKRKDKGES